MPWSIYLRWCARGSSDRMCILTDRYDGQFNIFLELHYQRSSSNGTNSGSVDFIFGTSPLGFGRNFLHLFCSGSSLEDANALFDLGWHCWLSTGIYGDELRIDHIYRSINQYKQMLFLHMSFWASQLRACEVFQTDWSFLWLQFQLVRSQILLWFPSLYLRI